MFPRVRTIWMHPRKFFHVTLSILNTKFIQWYFLRTLYILKQCTHLQKMNGVTYKFFIHELLNTKFIQWYFLRTLYILKQCTHLQKMNGVTYKFFIHELLNTKFIQHSNYWTQNLYNNTKTLNFAENTIKEKAPGFSPDFLQKYIIQHFAILFVVLQWF
jgi:hypothetical protein